MFRLTRKPSSQRHRQYLAKITSLVQCRYRRRTDVVSAMAAYYGSILCHHSTDNVCKHLYESQ